MEWTPESLADPRHLRKLELALENCMMLARRKRAIRHTYQTDGKIVPKGPKSDDSDWNHIARFCREGGSCLTAQRCAGELPWSGRLNRRSIRTVSGSWN